MKPEPTVFIVDDDAALRDSLMWLVKSADLKAETFESAESFLDAYEPGSPGCLVLDIRMPGMSGLELQEKLVDMDVALPVITMTGYGDPSAAIRARKNGAFEFVEKPFDYEVMLDLIERCLEGSSGAPGSRTS